MSSLFTEAKARLEHFLPATVEGQVADVVGLTIECDDFAAPVGAQCLIWCRHGREPVEAEVVGFRETRSILMPYGEMRGFSRGDRVRMIRTRQSFPVGPALIGRVLNARGEPVDGKPAPDCPWQWNIYNPAPDAFRRPVITRPITTGVKTIDGLFTAGQGQRMGIFAGSGVGKSTLLSMITRNTDADVVVLGLVGERGRELREFIEKDLGEAGLRRSVVVCETSDRPPLLRVKAAFAATAVAEYFRAQGKKVMLLMDSLTRMAMAQREIGLSAGEPPTTKGYPPSVFNMMPRLLERTGATDVGSITAFYTVLVEGDDVNEPIADTVRGILDGHIWLKRSLANKGHFPAVSVPDSISRLMTSITAKDHQEAAMRLRDMYSTYLEAEDLINIGAYRPGSNHRIDEAMSLKPGIDGFLRQDTHEMFDLPKTVQALKASVGLGDADASQKAAGVAGLRTTQLSPGVASAIGGSGMGQGRGAAAAKERTLGRPAQVQNERLTRPAQQRMPDQQPLAMPGQHPVRAPGR
jgi:flagellum-specific ATP synthase